MLSRAITARRLTAAALQHRSASSAVAAKVPEGREVLQCDEGPERDLVNFPRLKRPELPGKTRLGFLPEEWFQFFYPKTGVTGPYLFGTGLVTYLYSKEMMVMDHEFYVGTTMIFMAVYAHKKFGKSIASSLDQEIDTIEANLKAGHIATKKALEDSIEIEKLNQTQTACQAMIFDAKKENIALQLETEFRNRQMQVYNDVKKRLDYHLEVINIQRRMQQKDMVDWIVSNVQKSISAQQEKDMLSKCITDLKGMAAKA